MSALYIYSIILSDIYNFFSTLIGDYTNLLLGIIFVAIGVRLIFFIRSYDSSFEKPWIHYVLFIVEIPTILLLCEMSMDNSYNVLERILLLLVSIIFGAIIIYGGWGIRQCGMYHGMYHKNENRQYGEFLIFLTYMFLTLIFWHTIVVQLFEWSMCFSYHQNTFGRYGISFIMLCCAIIVNICWLVIVIPIFLKTAGNFTLYIITIVLGIAFMIIWYRWIYTNFDGITFLIILLISSSIIISNFRKTIGTINEIRCPRCHNYKGEHTNTIDHGFSQKKSTKTVNIDGNNIKPRNYGATVTNAYKKILTIKTYHKWTTIHTCSICGHKWNINHSKEVERRSQKVGQGHEEIW